MSDQPAEVLWWYDMIHVDMVEGAQHHARIRAMLGVLDHRKATSRLDGAQARRTVVQGAGEEDADDAGTVASRGAAK